MRSPGCAATYIEIDVTEDPVPALTFGNSRISRPAPFLATA
jgi:hypothetical protein